MSLRLHETAHHAESGDEVAVGRSEHSGDDRVVPAWKVVEAEAVRIGGGCIAACMGGVNAKLWYEVR